ncbi:MAG: hypothetical protein IJA94_01675 [Bacilli bacterium]|nr:hypothetical protein [Bacilli bacterium]
MENNNSVKGKLSKEVFHLINTSNIKFKYGEISFLDEKNINEGQAGFRFNAITGEKIEDWIGDEYVIIGYDSTAGCGQDPYIIKTDEINLPVYWLMTDGGEWSNPDLICDSLENFNRIIKFLEEYSEYFIDEELTDEIKGEILNKISEIEGKEKISDYWENLLNNAMPFESQ